MAESRERLNKHGVTHQEEKFCQEYIKTLDRDVAAKKAGFKSNRTVYNLMRRPRVKDRLDQLEEEVAKRNAISVDQTLRDLETLYQLALQEPDKRLAAGVNAKVWIGKHLKMFTERYEDVGRNTTDAELIEKIREIDPRIADVLESALKDSSPTTH